jgi:hypothetical protein
MNQRANEWMNAQLQGRMHPTFFVAGRRTDERRRLQCVQPPTSSDLPPNPARVSRSGYADMAPSDSRSVNRYCHDPSVCKFPINVTVPSPWECATCSASDTRASRDNMLADGCGLHARGGLEANRVRKKQSSPIIAVETRRFGHVINKDGVFGTHSRGVEGATWRSRSVRGIGTTIVDPEPTSAIRQCLPAN